MLQCEAEVEYLRAAVSGASTARGDVQESRKELKRNWKAAYMMLLLSFACQDLSSI